MPRCIQCNQLLPPDLCESVSDTEQKCLFCKFNKDTVSLNKLLIKKSDAIEDYKIFLAKLANLAQGDNFKEALIQNAIKKEGLKI